MGRLMNRNFLNAGLLATAIFAGSMSGCVGYNVYPPETGTAGFTDPNAPPMYQIMTEALKWAVKKYPPGGQLPPTAADIPISASEAEAAAQAASHPSARVAISLFSSMKPDIYEYAVQQVGQGAVPLTPETENLPRYMVSRVSVRGDEAKVDVFKPVLGASPTGEPLYQPVTVNLRGGMKFWRVTSYRVWSIGTFAAPGPEYLPGSYTPIEDPAPIGEDTGITDTTGVDLIDVQPVDVPPAPTTPE